MVSTIEVQGMSYPAPESFTYKELSTIKKISGVRAGEIAEAIAAGDTDLTIALAVIVMERAGLKPDVEKLYALEADQISATGDEEKPEEDEALPPAAAVDATAAEEDATVREIRPATREASGAQ